MAPRTSRTNAPPQWCAGPRRDIVPAMRRVLALALLFVACAPRARGAQGHLYHLPREPPRDLDLRETAPTIDVLETAIGAYKSERYPQAATGFAEVVAGRAAGDLQTAAFWLAKTRVKLADDEQAIALFVAIAGDPEHPYYVVTLPWLANLRVAHPDDLRLDRAIGAYPLVILEREELTAVIDDLRVAIAAHHLRGGDVQLAWSLASAVPVGCDAYREAQLIAGLAIDRLGRRDEAIARLQAAAAPVSPVRPRSRRPSTPREELDAVVRARARTELERRGVRARRSRITASSWSAWKDDSALLQLEPANQPRDTSFPKPVQAHRLTRRQTRIPPIPRN